MSNSRYVLIGILICIAISSIYFNFKQVSENKKQLEELLLVKKDASDKFKEILTQQEEYISLLRTQEDSISILNTENNNLRSEIKKIKKIANETIHSIPSLSIDEQLEFFTNELSQPIDARFRYSNSN